MSQYDAIVIGSGPNGLSAAVEMAKSGAKVLVLEAAEWIGGGTRTAELTLPGYLHDFCSAVHPMGGLSPFFRELPLERYGLEWIHPPASVAHPLENEPAVLLTKSVAETAQQLGADARAWEKMVTPFLENPHGLLKDALGPLAIPRHPFLLARFGLQAIWSAKGLANMRFKAPQAKALFAGCAGHSILPLEMPLSAAVGLIFAITGHVTDWPVAAGGSASISNALAAYLKELGGEIRTSVRIKQVDQLPDARVFLFDTDPKQLASIAEPLLPARYVRRLRNYRYGPGVFKIDWALDGPIPWSDPRCLQASTVHIGGTLPEIAASEHAAWHGTHSEQPFLILCQQSQFDPSRAPAGKHTGYAYCHVPHGSTVDMTDAIEQQITRFAPDFKDIILQRHTTNTHAFSLYNPNNVGGAITGGAADLFQLFTRPVARLDPYATPHPRLFICSASTPPGGGVHGMCGYHAARSALKRLDRQKIAPLL